jgi:hypothetical protein
MKKVGHLLDVRVVTKKEAAQRQIDVAINLLYEKEYESAITLAGAAEGQIAGSDHHLFAALRQVRSAEYDSTSQRATHLNETRDWLKHATPHLREMRGIAEFEAWVMVIRAISKYYAVFREETKNMNRLIEWSRARDLPLLKLPPDPPSTPRH